MTREDKVAAIAELKEDLSGTPFFYLADSSTLPVSKINQLRRLCFERGITIKVAKNTLIQKALEGGPASKGYAALYEAPFAGQTLTPNGNIAEQPYAMTIPVNPGVAATKEATSLGPIGMALNGVAIYNDREGGNVPVDANTLRSIDRAGAHTSPGGTYHYHFDNEFLSYDDANLFGFLRDGFPLYGRKDQDGSYPADLDTNGGHVGTTADFAAPIYHYHSSRVSYMNSRFYILKAGSYHGTKGTFTF